MKDSPEKLILDGISVLTAAGALVAMLPAIAAVFTIVWTGIRIWETETVQGWFGKEGKDIEKEFKKLEGDNNDEGK